MGQIRTRNGLKMKFYRRDHFDQQLV